MKKAFFSVLALTAAATSASAGTLNLDLRADYSSVSLENAPGTPDSTRFYLRTGRLDYQGKAFEDVSFRVRLAFTKDPTQNNTDAAQTAVEYAFLTHKLSDLVSVTAGRMNTDVGGFEGTTSGSDLYLLSPAYSTSGAAGSFTGADPAKSYGTSNLLYMTGAKVTLSFLDGSNSLQLAGFNQKNDEKTNPMDQNGPLVGAVYKGSFMDKALNFIASYHTSQGAINESKYQWMAAGVLWASDPVAISVDYLLNDLKNEQPTSAKNELSTIVVKAAYTGLEQWVPRVDYFSSKRKNEIAGAIGDIDYVGYGAVLEYKPHNDKGFRYHVAYTNIKETPIAGNDITRHEVIVGTRFLGDFLK